MRDVDAVHVGRTAGGSHPRGQHSDRGRLACTVGAEEAEHFARSDGEAHSFEGLGAARAVALVQLAHLDDVAYGGHDQRLSRVG